jgi:carboxyl-terminal processing protease
MKQRWWLILAVAVLSFFSGGWLLQQGVQNDGGVYRQARLFDEVMSHVQAYYVDSLGEANLYNKATEGLLDQLQDPYSVLLQGESYQALNETTTGNYGGLGIQIDVRDGWITVVAPLPDTPAERAGVETGDQIVAIDGKSTEGWKNDEAVRTLRGAAGSKVKLTVRRPGVVGPLEFDLVRALIHVRSVSPGTLFDHGVGYVSLNTVSETSATELKAEIDSLRAKGMKALVLDLRGNPGGLLDQGVEVSDLFLDPKQEIVSTRGRARGASRQYFDELAQRWPDLPIVALVDVGSASAAEIIAGALQDHDRAVVVGVPTFGKGLVQSLFRLDERTALKLTTARWFTPSGRTIQRTAADEHDQVRQAELAAENGGLVPDSARAPEDTASLPEFKTDAGRTVRGGGGIVPDMIVRPDSFTTPEREFAKALGTNVPAYRDALTSYALEIKDQKTVTSPAFTVTPAMRSEVYRRLVAKGVTIPEPVYQGAGQLVDDQLGYEIARYVFGRPAEFRRRAGDDRQLQAAVNLLQRASTPKALLNLTMREAGSTANAN